MDVDLSAFEIYFLFCMFERQTGNRAGQTLNTQISLFHGTIYTVCQIVQSRDNLTVFCAWISDLSLNKNYRGHACFIAMFVYSDAPSRASMLTRTVSSFLDKQIM